jgi:hypothetical protein
MPAERFALQLLKDNAHLGEFEVTVQNSGFPQEVKEALERLGCSVSLKRDGVTLVVVCPGQ